MRNLLISFGILLALVSTNSFANDEEIKKTAVSEGEQCVQKCNEYYKEKNHLRGFSFYKSVDLANKSIFGVLLNTVGQGLYCLTAADSLGRCYQKDSSAYNVCKWITKKTVEAITSDVSVVDMFSSCKDTCLHDLKKKCGPLLK